MGISGILAALTARINFICYQLEFSRFMLEEKREQLLKELKSLIDKRDKYNEFK
tara:strand:- start:312 stop:473 length:162 start_codon:yes stop_codon:yes gene_type:complete